MLTRKRDKISFVLHVIFYYALGGGLLYLGWKAQMAAPGVGLGGFFHAAGLFFFGFGTVYALRPLKVRSLKKSGRPVWAKIEKYESEAAVRASGDFGYRLIAVYTDPAGQKHTFKSQLIYDYEARDLVGKHVRVYLGRNEKHYYMDATSLLGDSAE